MSDRDLDAEFARIIAGWDDEAPDPQLRRPLEPQQAEPDAARPETGDPAGQATPSLPDEAADNHSDNDGRTPPANGQPASGTPGPPGTPTPPAAAASSGLLELPIAPTTPHVWRGSTEPQDDPADAPATGGTTGRTTGRTAGNGADDAGDDDEHFVPPSEIDLPSAENDPMFWAIVGGLVGGPLLLLYLLFFDRDGSGWWLVTALAMVVVGFVLLVLRGGTERDPFDDGTRL